MQPCFLRVLLAGLPTCPLGQSSLLATVRPAFQHLLLWMCTRQTALGQWGVSAPLVDLVLGEPWWFLNPGVFLSLLLRHGQLKVSGC